MRAIGALLVSAVLLAGCVHTVIQTCPDRGKRTKQHRRRAVAAAAQEPALPAFPLAALNGPHALRAKLTIDDDGRFSKYVVYVDRAAVPDWVHALADKELGQGEDVEYEVEQYADGAMAFEVTRKVGENTVELSVDSVERSKRYIERKDLPLNQLPPKVRKAAEEVTGFALERYDRKERVDGSVSHELHGKLADREHTVCVAEDGQIVTQTVDLPATLKVAR